jgi:hypothetical protein
LGTKTLVVNSNDCPAPADKWPDPIRQHDGHRPFNLPIILMTIIFSDIPVWCDFISGDVLMKFLRQLRFGWKEIVSYIGDFQARWLLTVLYFTFVLPFGLITRLVKDPLSIRHRPIGSAWIKREARKETGLEEGRKQY